MIYYQQNTIIFLTFTEWHTTLPQYPTQIPTHQLTASIANWYTYNPNITQRPGTHPSPLQDYIDRFRKYVCLHFMSHATRHLFTPNELHISDHDITIIIKTYNSLLILTIDGSFTRSMIPHIYSPHQPYHLTKAYTGTSVTIIAINNSNQSRKWMHLPIMSIRSQVQPLPAAYGTHNVTNNTVECFELVLACELIPPHTPIIIIYDSTVVHI